MNASQTLFDSYIRALVLYYADRVRHAGRHALALSFLNRLAFWQDFVGSNPGRFRRYCQRPALLRQDRMMGYDALTRGLSQAVTEASAHVVDDPRDGSVSYHIEGELLGVPDGFEQTVRSASRVRLHVNCPGGCVSRTMLDALEAHPRTEAYVKHAGSAGCMLALACGRRSIAPAGSLLLHSPVGAVLGDAEEMRKAADCLDRERRLDEQFLARRTRLSRRQCRQIMSGGDHYFDPEQAVHWGLVHQIADPPTP